MAADAKEEEERRKMPSTLLNSTREMNVKSSASNDNLRKKVKFNSAFNIDIPQDILLQIFCKLPVKSLIRFSCASKLWFYLIIKDQQFNQFYMVESKKKPILIFTFKDCEAKRWYYLEKQHLNTYGHKLLICNPSRIEKLIFVSCLKHKWGGGYICGYRFGYDPLSNEYKAVLNHGDRLITHGQNNDQWIIFDLLMEEAYPSLVMELSFTKLKKMKHEAK
ncbi:hypothetical protein C5167_044449 [Papaver somniferum]|uniref:F-box domain-containing protein n=1 Tax=Papaver somniferum TaxID=3469 RepID=A0A4Y7L9D2_PAPSO|nr:hypothetical protein C5167_044449 [Papaver somniferum]